MKFFNGDPTFESRTVTDESGNVKLKDGHPIRKMTVNFNWKSAGTIIVIAGILVKGVLISAQTVDSTKKNVTKIKSLTDQVDTLKNTVIINQYSMNKKMELMITLLDPEKGKAKLDKIEKDSFELLKQLEAKKDENRPQDKR